MAGGGALAEARRGWPAEGGRGGLLDDLLVPALQRAVALAEMDHVAVPSPRIWTSMWRGRSRNFSM